MAGGSGMHQRIGIDIDALKRRSASSSGGAAASAVICVSLTWAVAAVAYLTAVVKFGRVGAIRQYFLEAKIKHGA